MNSPSSEIGIVDYYDQAEVDYKLVWHLGSQLAMHYGFWDADAKSLRSALQNENAVLAKLARIQPNDHVLDAGCGVGGSSLFLAEHVGCNVTGISLSSHQVAKAQAAATKRNVSERARFVVADFTATGLPDASFDVIWAIESVCHAADKRDFIQEAYRLLRPGGRLIVADGFARSGTFTTEEHWIMRQWLDGWSVPDLASLDDFKHQAQAIGFRNVQTDDYTTQVMPSAKRLYQLSRLGAPIDWLTRTLHLRSQRTGSNFLAARYQYVGLQQKLWQYGVVLAEKR